MLRSLGKRRCLALLVNSSFNACGSTCIGGKGCRTLVVAAAAMRGTSAAQQLAQEQQAQRLNLTLVAGCAAGMAIAAGCTDAHAQEQEKLPVPPAVDAANASEVRGLVPLREKQRLFFLYEKRIRELSNAEKVFEYFANDKRDNGTAYMRPQDLLAALVAVYPPDGQQAVRSGSLPGEPKIGIPKTDSAAMSNYFQKHFDIDGDGVISFHEYLLILTLLSIPLKDAETAFAMLDEDESGTIDKAEFSALTALLKDRSRQAAGAGAGRTGLKVESDMEDSGLMLHFFGESGEKKLDLAAFNAFLQGLHSEIDRLEFLHYDPQNTGFMSGRDFAHSMVASVSLHSIHQYLDKVDALPEELKNAKVSYGEFCIFAQLWRNVHSLAVATDLHFNAMGHFRKADFKRAAKKIVGRALSDVQVDIIYSLFDVEADGSLAVNEFVGVIRQRESRHQSASTGFEESLDVGLVQCLRNCMGW